MKTIKRALSLILALLMVLSLSPTPFALAEETEGAIAPANEPSPESAAPEDPVGDGVLDVPSDEPAAEPMPDEPQDDTYAFTLQPYSGKYAPTTLRYTAYWDTNFNIQKIEIIHVFSGGEYEIYDTVTDPSHFRSYSFPATSGTQEYYVRAYYGTGPLDYRASERFTVSDESLLFTLQPQSGSYDPDSLSYLATWQLSFTPLAVEIRHYTDTYTAEQYAVITNDLSSTGSYDFPATAGEQRYYLKAFYGTGVGDYVMSDDFIISDHDMVTSGDCGFMDASSVHWSYENHTLTLSGNGFTGDFPSMAIVPWDHLRSQITTVVVEEGIQDVGAYAFQDCLNLETVYLPSTVVKIGDYAFINCPKLADVYWNVGEQGMWDVTWTPSRNTSLAEANKHFAFIAEGQAGPNLTWRLANDGVLSFSGSGAMYNWSISEPAPWYSYRSKITTLRLANVTTVGDCAFRGCTKLTAVSFSSDLTYLGVRAFGSCTGLTTVYWAAPNFMNLTEIPEACFSGCTALQSFTVPKKCTVIGQAAFSGCDALTTVSFPEGSALTQVGNRAFYSCDALKNIPLPNGVTGLGDEAFYNCKSLTSFPLPSTLTSLGAYCFSGCSGVTGVVTIPAGLTQIPERCFLGCSGFYKLALTPKVTEIGAYAFSGCSKLMNVEYDGFRAQWENVSVGGGNTPLTSASFSWLFRSGKIAGTEVYWRIYGGPGKLEIYGSGNMKDWETTPEIAPWYSYRLYIETIDIHPSVESVGINAFRMCKNLKTVYLPDTLKKIGSGAFNDSSDLADVWYNGSELMREYKLTIDGYNNPLLRAQWHYADIGGVVTGPNGTGAVDLFWSFDPDSGTLRVYWSDEIMDQNHLEIPDYVDGQDTPWYQYNHGQLVPLIKAVQVDELVTRIGDYAFAGLDELTDVQIASTVTGIGEGAFMGCRNLIVITIPDTVETLDDNLFWNCGSLETATLPAGLTAIPSGTFFNCEELTRVYLPGTLERIEKNAFDRCTGLTDIYFNGTSAQWQAIELYSGNDPVNSAKIHFTPPEIAVDAVNFPDLAFRAYVTENIDTDRSGWLTDEECLAVTSIVCPNQQVASLQGIQFFPELSYLNAGGNMLTGDLDLTANSRLSFLDVSRNQLNNVILTDLTSLTMLLLAGNDTGMNAPDLSTNIALEYLDCRGCDGMEGLDLSANTALITLDCSWNQIETLDLSANTALQTLDCSHNNLTSLDLSANTELRQLSCNNNVLPTLTLGNQDKLFTLACYGNSLSRLDLTGCPRLLAAVQEGTVTETESYLEYRRGADYVQADKSTLLITAHYSLLGLRASAAGVVQDSAGKYMLSSVQRTPVWQGGNAPGFTALINSTSVICSDEATVRPITAEPVPGGVYFLYLGLSTNTQSQGAVDFSHLSAADCSLILPGFSCECIRVTIGVTSGGNDKATILFRITKDAPEGIPIDEEHFPDANFRAYVAEDLDPNGDLWLTPQEIAAVEEISCAERGIASLQGIACFSNLDYLDCSYNQLLELDLSGNALLTELDCSFNETLTALDLSALPDFELLTCSGCILLTQLDLRNNPELTELDCRECALTALDLRSNGKLWYLDCSGNALTALDLSALPALGYLMCNDNQLTELSLDHPALQYIDCYHNALTALDLSACNALTYVDCSYNGLETLTLGEQPLLKELYCHENSLTRLDLTGCPLVQDAVLTTEGELNEGTMIYSKGQVEFYVDPGVVLVTDHEGIPIDEAHFPDAIFRTWVSQNTIDFDGNGWLTDGERMAVKQIEVISKDIASLKGIEYFYALEYLDAEDNPLTELDLSENTVLKTVSLCYCQLESVDVTGLELGAAIAGLQRQRADGSGRERLYGADQSELF